MKKKEFENMIVTPESLFEYSGKEYNINCFDKIEGLISLYDAYEPQEEPRWVRYENVEPVNIEYRDGLKTEDADFSGDFVKLTIENDKGEKGEIDIYFKDENVDVTARFEPAIETKADQPKYVDVAVFILTSIKNRLEEQNNEPAD